MRGLLCRGEGRNNLFFSYSFPDLKHPPTVCPTKGNPGNVKTACVTGKTTALGDHMMKNCGGGEEFNLFALTVVISLCCNCFRRCPAVICPAFVDVLLNNASPTHGYLSVSPIQFGEAFEHICLSSEAVNGAHSTW